MKNTSTKLLGLLAVSMLFASSMAVADVYGVKAQGKSAWIHGSAANGIVCGDRLCSEVDKVQESQESSDAEIPPAIIESYSPPLKQISDGVTPNDVVCNEDLKLVIKSSNMHPACVKVSSISKLMERGWIF